MQERKLYFGFLPVDVSNKECADTAMAMTLISLLVILFTKSLTLLPLPIGLLLLGMVWPRAYSPLADSGWEFPCCWALSCRAWC